VKDAASGAPALGPRFASVCGGFGAGGWVGAARWEHHLVCWQSWYGSRSAWCERRWNGGLSLLDVSGRISGWLVGAAMVRPAVRGDGGGERALR